MMSWSTQPCHWTSSTLTTCAMICFLADGLLEANVVDESQVFLVLSFGLCGVLCFLLDIERAAVLGLCIVKAGRLRRWILSPSRNSVDCCRLSFCWCWEEILLVAWAILAVIPAFLHFLASAFSASPFYSSFSLAFSSSVTLAFVDPSGHFSDVSDLLFATDHLRMLCRLHFFLGWFLELFFKEFTLVILNINVTR